VAIKYRITITIHGGADTEPNWIFGIQYQRRKLSIGIGC